MSAAAVRVLTAAEQRELRHELRTPFNHLLGYAELLLDSANDPKHEPLVPGLKKLAEESKSLLRTVNSTLSAQQTFSHDDAVALLDTIRAEVPRLRNCSDELLALARDAHLTDTISDLQRIEGAIDALAGFQLRSTAAPLPEIQPEPPVAPKRHSLGPGLVLVADDNSHNRDLLCRRLQREGLATLAVEDGLHALEQLAQHPFDLVLLDLIMPGLNGDQILEQIKASEKLRDIPVIMISAIDEIERVVTCLNLGAEDYLPKPFDPTILRARVGAILEKKRLRDRELAYLRGVAQLEQAASAVETGQFDPTQLHEVASRTDELGRLARVFQRLAERFTQREKQLKDQVEQLKIEIDMVRLSNQVEEVTQTPIFDSLREARDRLRHRRGGEKPASGAS